MAADTSGPDRNGDERAVVARIVEINRTIRYLAVCGTIAFGVWCIVKGVVAVLDEPPWLKLVGLLIVVLVGPSGIIHILITTRNRAVKKQHRRVVFLEQQLDPNRLSSEQGHRGDVKESAS